jgi:hypothetical protein
MRRCFVISVITLLIQLFTVATFAQQATPTQSPSAEGVEGRWTGTMQVPNGGEMEMAVTFKKDKDIYTGSINVGAMPEERAFKSVKVDGDKVQAQAEFETPDRKILVNYNFTLKENTLKGTGEVDFGGQKMAFDISLKRVTEK